MALRLAAATRSVKADAAVDRLDAGSGPGTIKVYTGTQPATPATSPSGTLLATFTLNDPAYGAAAAGVATLDVDPALTTTGVAAGDAGWFRAADSVTAAYEWRSGRYDMAITDGDTTERVAEGRARLSRNVTA